MIRRPKILLDVKQTPEPLLVFMDVEWQTGGGRDGRGGEILTEEKTMEMLYDE